MPRVCACGREIPFGSTKMGPVSQIRSLKFYENAAMFGYPSSRQEVYLCDKHTHALIDLLKEIKRDGPDPGEVSE